VAKRCVLEQNLLLTAYRKSYTYEKSIGTKMNDLDPCLEERSCQPHCVAFDVEYLGNR